MTRFVCLKCFRLQKGMPFVSLLTQSRLLRALKLLDKNYPLKKIIAEVAISSVEQDILNRLLPLLLSNICLKLSH